MGFLKQFALGAVISIDLTNQSMKNLGQLTKGVNEAQTGIAGLVRGTARASAAIFAQIGLAGTFAAGAIAGLGYQTAQFDKAMQGVASVSPTSVDDMKKLRKGALDLSGAFSSTEIAGAMEEMRRAGFNVEDTLKGISTVSNVAQADEMSLAEATEVVGGVWRSFGGDFQTVGDVLTRASADTATNIQRLGLAVSYAGPTARLLGIDLQTTTAALAELAQHGIDGQKAGRGLSTVLLRLAHPTKEMGAVLDELHFKWKVNADGSANLIETLKSLSKELLKYKSDVKKTSMAEVLFGKDQAKAGINLVTYIGNIEKEHEVLQKVNDDAAKMAETRLDTPIGQLTILKNKALSLAIMMGDEFTPGVTSALKALVQGLKEVTDGFNGIGGGFLSGVGQGLKLAIDDISNALTSLKNLFDVFTDDINTRLGDSSTMLGRMVGFMIVMGTVGLATFGPIAGALAVILYMFSGIGEAMLWIAGGGLALLVIGLDLLAGAFVTSTALGMGLMDFFWVISHVALGYWNDFVTAFAYGFQGAGLQVNTILTLLMWAWQNFMTGIRWSLALFWTHGAHVLVKMLGMFAAYVVKFGLMLLSIIALVIYFGSVLFKWIVAPLGAILADVLMMFAMMIVGTLDMIFAALDKIMTNHYVQAGAKYLGIDFQHPDVPDVKAMAENVKKQIVDAMNTGLDIDAKGKGEQRTPGVDAPVPTLIDKRCLHIHNEVALDGKQVGKAMKEQDVELSERAGFQATPWQKRMILEHGAVPMAR